MENLKFEEGENKYRIWRDNRIIGYLEEQEAGFWLYDQRPNDVTTWQELKSISEFIKELEETLN